MGTPRKLKTPLDYEQLFMDLRTQKGQAFQILLKLFRGQYKNIGLSLMFFVIKHSPVWIIPIVTADMINIVSHPGDRGLYWLYIELAIISLVIVQNVPTQLMHTYFMSKASRHIEAALRSTIIRKLQHLSMSYHSELRSGKLQSKVLRDVEAIEALSKQMMFAFVPAILNVIVATVITVSQNLMIASFFLLACPVAIALMLMFKGSIRRKNQEFRKQIEEISGQVAETVEMIPVTRAHGLEDEEIIKIDTALENLKGKGRRLDVAEALFGASSWVVFTLFQMFCLTFTCTLVYKGQIHVGDVVMYQGFFTTILMSINQIMNVYPQFAKGFESLYSVTELLTSTQVEEYQGTRKPERVLGAFRFENVKFHYEDTEKHVLNGFDLEVQPGECIAFVGESGAGKSTVLNMLVGFYRPTDGQILLDGMPFDELNMRAYRQKLAVVPQSTILFSGTIRENITYGLSDISEESIQRIIEMANLHDVVAAMPQGLDTMIGEHGNKLSGGQRQRIAIARAMIRNPKIILLDEATSALDNVSEFHVQKAMKELTSGRTTFIVAHRLSTIRDADRIVVVKKGRVEEVGTFEELMERRGAFYQLKQMQA
jgi:ATP-binding cassette subfamily B protein